MTWRDQCKPIIARVLAEMNGEPERDIKAALKAAYPFGIREYHPYKIWCDEIKVQRGKKKLKVKQKGEAPQKPSMPGQKDLFAMTLELTQAPMSQRRQRELIQRFCQRQASYMWGERRMITPVLLPIVWGDGRKLIALRPIVTRQSHYVIAGDSRWTISDRHGRYATFREHLKNGIYDEIEDRWGICKCPDCTGEEDREPDLVFKQWPTPCLSGGCEWWQIHDFTRREQSAYPYEDADKYQFYTEDAMSC